jgi:DNA-binding CsgD family transcriptional regulator
VAHVDHRVQPGAKKIVGGHQLRSPKLPGTDVDWNQSREFALLAFTPQSQHPCGFSQFCRADYLDAGCFAHDPWLAYAAHHSEPIAASSLPVLDAEGQRVIALAQQNGFASAALVPAHSGTGHSRISLLCLGSTSPAFFEGEGFGRFRLGARLIAAELHDWWLARIRRELIVKARITQADLELLRHEHQGHSSKRIAAELHVSKSSINSRFQRMNMKLGVPNRRLAARLAVECGLLIG